MGKVKGFKEFDRIDEKYLPISRLKNYNEFTLKVKKSELESIRKMHGLWSTILS